jgi:hypothetical protein
MAQEYEKFKITPDMYLVKPNRDASKLKATTDEPK